MNIALVEGLIYRFDLLFPFEVTSNYSTVILFTYCYRHFLENIGIILILTKITTMGFIDCDSHLSSLTGLTDENKTDDSVKNKCIYPELPPSIVSISGLNSRKQPKNNENYLKAFERELHALKVKRIGILKGFELSICHDGDVQHLYGADLCHIIDQYKSLDVKIYFNAKHSELTAEEQLLHKVPTLAPKEVLLRSIQNAAVEGGDTLISNGGILKGTTGKRMMLIRCSCVRATRSNKGSHFSEYRIDSMTNNRKNNRHGNVGKHGKHRCGSVLPLRNNALCPFSLPIYNDENGYYVRSKYCQPHHEFHPRRGHIRISRKLIHGDEMQIIQDSGEACSMAGTGRNLHYIRSRRKQGSCTLLSTRQVTQIYEGLGKTNNSKKWTDGDTPEGNIDHLYALLRDKKYSHVSLLQARDSNIRKDITPVHSHGTNCKSCNLDHILLTENSYAGRTITEPGLASDKAVFDEANKFALAHRRIRKIKEHQEMMIALAFASQFQLRQHSLFPEVIHMDATADTCKESRPLLTLTAKDSNGKFFTILSCYLPNEKAWSFKWFFTEALPKLVWPSSMERTKYIITDGDHVCISQLEDAITNYMPHTRRGRCSWHIIDRGWADKVRLPLGGYSNRKRAPHMKGKKRKKPGALSVGNKLGRVFYRWMFSWAQAEFCVSKEEFEVSKSLFLHLLEQDDCKHILSEEGCRLVGNFYHEHVYPHLDHMCHHTKLFWYFLDEHTNCGQEGTHNAMKNCAAPVTPKHNLDRAVEINTFNEEVKNKEIMIQMCRRSNEDKNWSQSPTSTYITDLAESIIRQEWISGSENYIAHRSARYRWLVKYKGTKGEEICNL